jgi:hypothetical protein
VAATPTLITYARAEGARPARHNDYAVTALIEELAATIRLQPVSLRRPRLRLRWSRELACSRRVSFRP